ncbi:MAG: FtsX-like permease family protein, partial [Vicinamibacterales bacterium]
ACVNIANLLLARGARRARELGIRTALGAGRARVVRQLLTESVLLAMAGGVVGVLLGWWGLGALIALAPAGTPRISEIHLDGTVLLFSAALTIATGFLFGLAPALRASRRDAIDSLKDGTRGDTGGGGRRVHLVLIASEIALALVLLTGSGLLLQTLVRLQRADLGFDPSNVVTAFVNPPRTGYETPAKLRAYYDQVLQKASALPGTQTAALASMMPLTGDSDVSFTIEGRPAPTSESDKPDVWYRLVSASYFDALGVKLTGGRAFTEGETAPSLLVNGAFARMFFPGENPIGHRIRPDNPGAPWFTIIGTVADMKTRGPREAPRPQAFIPYWQVTEAGTYVVVKTRNAPGELAGPLKAAVASIDPSVPLQSVQTLGGIVSDSIDEPRFIAWVAGAFALLALVLAAIGIYGVMAYAVSQRTREIGVRMALGATRSQVFVLVVGQGATIAAAGVAAGIGGSLMVARGLSAQLYGVAPADPATLAATSAILAIVAVAASAIPARRATAVDPMEALRQL